jgi:hypothetical protein
MHIAAASLKPLSAVTLTPDESAIIRWIRSAQWEAGAAVHGVVPYKAKVPELFGGSRMYRMQGAGGNPIELLLKKLQFSGIVGKLDMYPLATVGAARYLTLTKADLDNLGVGADAEDDD